MNLSRTNVTAPYTVAVNTHLKRLLWGTLLIYPVASAAGYWYLTGDGATIESKEVYTFLVIMGICFVGFVIYALINLNNTITFHPFEQKVVHKNFFGEQVKMTFDQIGAVKPFTNLSTGVSYYALYPKEDLYKTSPLRVSPTFPRTKDGQQLREAFEETHLSVIETIIRSTPPVSIQDSIQSGDTVSEADLRFYRRKDGAYYQLAVYSQSISDFFFIALCLIFSIPAFTVSEPCTKVWYFAVGFGLVGLYMIYKKTQRRYITNNQFITDHIFGIQRNAYSADEFVNFQITHHRLYFIYTYTDVYAQFGSKMVLLYETRKTADIDRLLSETTYLLDR